MSYALLASLWLLTSLGAMTGWRCGGCARSRATVLAVLPALLLVAGAWFTHRLSWLPEWLISTLTVYLYGSWFAPPAGFLFLLAARQAREREKAATICAAGQVRPKTTARRNLRALVALTLVVLVAASVPLLGPPDIMEDVTGLTRTSIDANNVVHQTTGYTCGPAACATLLRRLAIDPGASEKDMVPLCLTRRWGGATTLGMAVGLKHKAAPQGWHIRIVEPDWDTFRRLRKPLLCSIALTPITGHAVVVCAVEEGRVRVADPMDGLRWWPKWEFRRRFLNVAVVVYREDPFERGE